MNFLEFFLRWSVLLNFYWKKEINNLTNIEKVSTTEKFTTSSVATTYFQATRKYVNE